MMSGFAVDNLSAWQIDQMVEDAAAQKWEELNEPDPNNGRKDESSDSLQKAIEALSKAWDWIYQAVDDVDGLPIADEIESFEEEVIGIKTGLKAMQDKLKGWG